jgi:hypothetical protein
MVIHQMLNVNHVIVVQQQGSMVTDVNVNTYKVASNYLFLTQLGNIFIPPSFTDELLNLTK